jgi:hypothetical protein
LRSGMRPTGTNRRRITRRIRKRLIGMLIAAAALLFAVPASAEALTVSGSAAPQNLQAGAHSNFDIHVDFGPTSQDVHDLTISLPPGQVGDPNATPLCTVAQLNADACPAASQVGTTTVNATLTVLLLPLTLNVNGTLYNLEPQPGEPARFGIVLNPSPIMLPPPLSQLVPLPKVILQSAVRLRTSDFGLDTEIDNIPKTTAVPLVGDVPTHINSMNGHLSGVAPNTGKPFLRNPTSCTPHHASFTAHPYAPATGTATADAPLFTPTGCGNLDFSPSFSAQVGGPGQTASGVPTTASTSIDQDLDEASLLKAVVNVPGDFNPNAALLGGLCDPASFQAGTCPPSSKVGMAIAASPLLSQPLIGPVALVSSGSALPNLGLDLQGQLHLLLQGTIDLNKTVTFDGLPDIPIAHFQLTFTSPPGLLGTTRDLCVGPPPLFHADFLGHNGATTSVDAPAIVDGCSPSAATSKGKCKKAKRKKHKKRAAEAKKKHKKKSCKKKKRKKRR